MAVGAIGAFHQNNLARWLAYGSTGHMGVIIGCFISFDFAGIAASIISFGAFSLYSSLPFRSTCAQSPEHSILKVKIAGSILRGVAFVLSTCLFA